MPRQPNDYSARLPRGWKDSLLPGDQQWIGQYVCNGPSSEHSKVSERFKSLKQIWFYPPRHKDLNIRPDPNKFCLRRLCLWAPRIIFDFDLKCPKCQKSLHSRGIYNKMRFVLDLKDYYYLGTEMLGCSCKATYLLTDQRIIDCLLYYLQIQFPAVLLDLKT